MNQILPENGTIQNMKDVTVSEWLTSLAAKQPTPGGGAAAALAAATAAALVGMVSNYTTGKKWLDREKSMLKIAATAETFQHQALDLIEADALAFSKVGAAYRLPGESDDEQKLKQAVIEQALIGAAEPPRATATLTIEIIKLMKHLVDNSNPNVISDVAVAASFAKAALESAVINIEINEKSITTSSNKETLRASIEEALAAIQTADAIVNEVRHKLATS